MRAVSETTSAATRPAAATPALATTNLEHAAETARAALEAHAVVLETRSSAQPRPTVVAVGISVETARALIESLTGLGAGNEPLLVDCLRTDGRTAEVADWERLELDSLISMPLSWEGRSQGVLHALGPRWPRSGRKQRERAMAVASHTALAVAVGCLSRRTVRPSQELEDLMSLDEVVLGAESLDQLGAELTARLAGLGAATGGIMLLDPERDVLRLLPGGFGASKDATASYRVRIDNPISNSARVFTTGEPYLSNEATGDPGIMQDYVDLFHVERLLSVPMVRGERRLGVLHLANKPEPFVPSDVYRAQIFAARLANVVELGTSVLALRRRQRATEVLVELAFGIASGKDIFDVMRSTFEQMGDEIGTDVLALVPPGGTPIVWRRPGLTPGDEEELLREAKIRSSVRPGITEPRGAGDPGHATLYVPVRLAGKRIAMIATLRQRAEPFVATEREVVIRMASLAAVGWATESYQRQRVEVAMLRDRQRIADDLHDTVTQIMFAAQLDLDRVLETDGLSDQARGGVLHARSLLLRGDTTVRAVIHQLSRPLRGGIAQRLGLVAEALEEEFATAIRVEVPPAVGEAAKSLRGAPTDALIKTAQEAITNAAKHAGPCAITVRLSISRRERLVLTVTDDGLGRQPRAATGHGLKSIRRSLRDCGGLLQITSRSSGGTRVLASVPL